MAHTNNIVRYYGLPVNIFIHFGTVERDNLLWADNSQRKRKRNARIVSFVRMWDEEMTEFGCPTRFTFAGKLVILCRYWSSSAFGSDVFTISGVFHWCCTHIFSELCEQRKWKNLINFWSYVVMHMLHLVVVKFTFKKITLLNIKLQFNVGRNVYS